MPIAENTVVKQVNKGRPKKDSTRERRVEEKRREEAEDVSSLFEIKESKYHEDMFSRDSRTK